MSYSAFFTAGLTLASQPRDYDYSFSKLPPLQINVHSGAPRRTRKRRSSLTIATSPISTIKSPARTANDATKSAVRNPSPRDGTFLEALHNGTRPRRKTVSNVKDLPSLPAPTTPLPTIPNLRTGVLRDMDMSSTPISPIQDQCSTPSISSDTPRLAYPPGTLRANPARKSSFLLPIAGRGALFQIAHAGSILSESMNQDHEKNTPVEVKMAPAAVWYDDEVDMENGGDV